MTKDKVKTVYITKTKGLSFFAALTILLLVLKVIGYDVPWWLILAAFFGPVLMLGFIVLGVLSFMIVCFIVAMFIEYLDERERKK